MVRVLGSPMVRLTKQIQYRDLEVLVGWMPTIVDSRTSTPLIPCLSVSLDGFQCVVHPSSRSLPSVVNPETSQEQESTTRPLGDPRSGTALSPRHSPVTPVETLPGTLFQVRDLETKEHQRRLHRSPFSSLRYLHPSRPPSDTPPCLPPTGPTSREVRPSGTRGRRRNPRPVSGGGPGETLGPTNLWG